MGAEDFDAEGAEYAAGAEEIKGSPMRQQCLAHELRSRGLRVEQQVRIPIIYKGLRLPNAYRVDLLVDGEVVVELKSVKQLHELHHAQLLSYLKLMKKRVGLLINFHSLHLKDGIKRMVNDF